MTQYKNSAVRKPLYVLVNAHAGSGKAVSLLTRATNIWEQHGIHFEIMYTDHAGHAQKIMSTLKYDEYSGFIAASGDGLLYEMVNGIMRRSDWKEMIEYPLGILPCGSGNGLASSIFYCQKKPIPSSIEEFVTEAARSIISFKITPMTLMFVQTTENQSLYSFLNIAWALPADVDYLSERFRFLSHARFDLVAFYFIFRRTTYKGILYFLPHRECTLECCSCKTDNASSIEDNNEIQADIKSHQSLLPPINEEVPSYWHKLEGNFILFYGSTKPLMTSSFFGNPKCDLSNDYITLHVIMDDASRFDVIKMLLATRRGDQFDYPRYHWTNAKAFRLELLCDNEILMVDGERINGKKIQAEVLPSLARAFG